MQAVEDMDAGPVWSTAEFPVPGRGVTKSSLYNGPVSDAALAVVHDVVAKAQDSAFTPIPLDRIAANLRGKLRPLMRQETRRIDWATDSADVVARKIHASDGSPGASTSPPRSIRTGQYVNRSV